MKTSLYNVLCVAVRLGAVLMAVGLIEQWPRLLVSQADGQISIAAIALDLLGLLVAFVLWLRPGLLAWWAAGNAQRDVFEAQISAAQLQYIAFSVAGIYKFISGLSGVVAHGLVLLEFQRTADAVGMPMASPMYERTLFVEYLVATLAGLVLVLGARGLTGYLQRLRGGHFQVKVEDGVEEAGKS